MFTFRILAAGLIAASLAGCNKPATPPPPPRPVRTVTVGAAASGETVSLTGQIRAKDEVGLAFRLDGRMIERPVHVGDLVKAGQVVARLDPQNQQNALRAAQANLVAAQAQLAEARLAFGRQQSLLKDGWTPRAKFDEAERSLKTAQAQVDSAQAQLRTAADQLGYTTLYADADGAVTAVGAEAGEVVRAGQMVVKVAHDGGRDAVFDVSEQIMRTAPHDPLVRIALADDPRVTALGRVREVSPQADSATRTFQVKVGIMNPPAAMRLGATVTGSFKLAAPPGVEIPAGALTELDGKPAVWVVDPKTFTVSLRSVAVLRYDAIDVVVSKGLQAGDLLVTAGVQTLHPGQRVRLLEAAR